VVFQAVKDFQCFGARSGIAAEGARPVFHLYRMFHMFL